MAGVQLALELERNTANRNRRPMVGGMPDADYNERHKGTR